MPLPLFRRRLVFVTGKGGVGKTTAALALGLAAANSGLRTIVADMTPPGGPAAAARWPPPPPLGGTPPGGPAPAPLGGDPQELEIAPNLFRISVDPQSAMEEYLHVKVPGAAGHALRRSRLFQAFAMATPGMREMLVMGKLWELAQLERRTRDSAPYDLVIVDAPASGHGVAILRTPRTFAEIARVGPIANQAQAIAETLADAAFTAVVAVSTPEEMPVNETLQLRDALASLPDEMHLELVILNGRYPDRFTQSEVEMLSRHADAPGAGVARKEHRRAGSQLVQERRLREAFGDRLLVLPFLFRPQIELPELGLLAEELER